MAKLVSKTYGEALFELAVEEGKEDEFFEEIQKLKSILDANPDFAKLMNHPKILKEEKLKVLEEVFEGRVSKEILGLLYMIVSKDRYYSVTNADYHSANQVFFYLIMHFHFLEFGGSKQSFFNFFFLCFIYF